MSSKPISGNLAGPFSMPIKYESPVIDGFIGVPRPSASGPGWGEPLKAPDGAPITPGTLGGANQAAVLSKAKGEWKSRRNPRIQQFGEISWRGPKKSSKPDVPGKPPGKRYILSYHGPSSRHFPTPFTYGSDSKHRNVYMEGGIVGICPGPVLGACATKVGDKRYLIAVCLAEGGEIVLRRALGGPVYALDEKKLEKLAQYATEEYPGGWVVAGTVSGVSDYDRPKTPWFFNESGTEAQCIRMKEKDATINGVSTKERAGDRFRLSVAGGAASVTPMGNFPPYMFQEDGKVTQKGVWTSPPWDGYVHYWYETNLNVNASCKGKQVVAVDYDGDTEVLVTAVAAVDYRMNQDYMRGCDAEFYPSWVGGVPPNYRNDVPGGTDWPYVNHYSLGVEPGVTVGNHTGSMWFGGRAWFYLSFMLKNVEYRVSIEVAGVQTAEEYADLPPNPNDRSVFLRYYEIQYVRHLDVRAGGFIVTRLDKFEEFAQQDTYSVSSEESVDTDFADDRVWTYLEGEKRHTRQNIVYHPRLGGDAYPGSTFRGNWAVVNGERTDPGVGKFWTTTPWSWTADTYIGNRPKDNDNSEIGLIPVSSWFPEQIPLYRKSWYGLKLLWHDFYQESAGFCQREDRTYILSGELPDPITGAPAPFIRADPETLEALVPGSVFYPLGEL